MIRYSSRARVAYARLFSPYNDIDVYVEDSSYVGLYERLINKALAGKAKVTRVTPLGPRNVVESRAANDTTAHGKPRLYIVDGDLDLLAHARMKKINRLYRLRVYSVENLLFELPAINEYCTFASPGMAAGTCAASVNPANLANDIDQILIPYVVVLGIARRLGMRGNVFAINPPSVANMIAGRAVGPCPTRVRRRVRDIIRAIIAAEGSARYRKAKQSVLRNLARKRLTGVQASPAKLFGLAYLNMRVEAAGGMALNQKLMASYLAEHVRLEHDKGLRAVIRKTAR